MPMVYSSTGAIVVDKILSDAGGQADVYHHGTKEVVKIFHAPVDDECYKLTKLMMLGAYEAIRKVATVPEGLLYDSRGLVGYRMRLAKDCIALREILSIEVQRQYRLSLCAIVELFIEFHTILKMMHETGFVVGDLHADNVLVNLHAPKGQRVMFIDVDGFGYYDKVGNEYFPVTALSAEVEHPRLQTQSLSGKALHRCHYDRDWFAFALHFAQVLIGLSPYAAGSVPGVFTEDERKKRGLTVMSPLVRLEAKYLPMYQRMGTFTEEVLGNWLTLTARGEFPLGVLTEYLLPHIVRCPKCHFETRASYWCPKCATVLQ